MILYQILIFQMQFLREIFFGNIFACFVQSIRVTFNESIAGRRVGRGVGGWVWNRVALYSKSGQNGLPIVLVVPLGTLRYDKKN